ncbi:MAG: hypothetical protein ACO3RV_06545 [Luteolibacter sp.]
MNCDHSARALGIGAVSLCLASLLAFAGSTSAESPQAGNRVAEEKAEKAMVSGTLVIPAELEAFEDRRLEIRLYRIHRFLADAPADLVDRVEIQPIAHVAGQESCQKFEIGGSVPLDEEMTYYITCFILDGDQRTHIGETEDKDLCRVLTDGRPRRVALRARAVR